MSKKILSVALALIMLLSVVSVSASALENVTEYPVILVPGYSGSNLARIEDDGSRTLVWYADFNEIPSLILKRIVDIGKGLVLTAEGDAHYLGEVIGQEAEGFLGHLKCNPDGSSVQNIEVFNASAQDTNHAYIRSSDELPDELIGEPELMAEIEQYIGDNMIFSFTEDWRMSVLDCAARLDSYIQEVKAYTGKDKVNLIAVSHGGQVTATYLSLYGYKQDVDNAVLTVPAAGGAALAYDIMSENLHLDEYTLVYFLEHGMVSESEFKWLVEAQELGFLDVVLEGALPYVKNVIGNFGSIWDFIPAEYYDDLKEQFLDPELNAAIIEKSDIVHYEIMPNYHEALTKCVEEYGMNVSIIAGTGNPSVTGLQENSDAIITTNDSTGATCAPYGLRFNDGYAPLGTTCADPAHHHVSPSLEVDGSTAYLPENTWYVDQLFHGMTFLDDYSRTLAVKLLLTDEITDVYSDPDYPQFHASTNASNTVFAKFDASEEGFLSSDDKNIIITNISKEHSITLSSITFGGVEYTAQLLGFRTIAPGESAKISLTGKLPEVSNQLVQVTVNYYCDNLLNALGTRTFDFTLMNGANAEYDAEEPYVASEYTKPVDSILGEQTSDKLNTFGIRDIISFFIDLFYSIMATLGLTRFINK